MSTVAEKEIKKELKELKKLCKKKKDPWAALCAIILAYRLKDKREIEDVKKNAAKVENFTTIEETIREHKNLESLPDPFGKLWTKLRSEQIDEEFKHLFSKLPSTLLKAELAGEFVPKLLEKGEADTALFFLNQLSKVKDPHIWLLTGRAYQIKGIVNYAKDYLEKAARDLPEAKRWLADLYIKQGNFQKAARIYQEMGDLERAALCYLEADHIKDAAKVAEQSGSREIRLKVALSLTEKGDYKRASELVKGLEDPRATLIRALAEKEKDPEAAFNMAKSALPHLSEKYKVHAIKVIVEHYNKEQKWKEITTLLAPLELSAKLPQDLRLKLAEAYAQIKEEARALKILANLMEGNLRREAKRLVKEIRNKTESQEIRNICESILSEDSFFKRLKEGLKKSKDSILGQLEALIEDKREIRDVTMEEIEEILLSADVGVEATNEIIANLKRRIDIGEIKSGKGLMHALEEEILRILKRAEGKLSLENRPTVIMVVGVNGTGKTTTIGKLGHRLKQQGYSVLFAAGDTFRAAAIEQLQVWGERTGIPVIKQKAGADPSGVVYDALQSAKARGIDVVIIDTAGRLHTKANLMEELKKMARIASKEIPGAPHETLLVLDAVTGQNALSQAKLFSEAIPITGIVLTKLDGTAKGGIIIAIAKKFGIPIKFIGVGEKIDDLQEFSAERFVDALFDR